MTHCYNCNKKIGIYNYTCKCQNLFCISCLTRHDCTFDRHEEQKEKLRKQMPKELTKKINKI